MLFVKYKNVCEKEVSEGDDFHDMTAIPPKKCGRSLTLGERLDTDIQEHIHALRLAGIPVSCSLIQATAEGIVVSEDRTLLAEKWRSCCTGQGLGTLPFKKNGLRKTKSLD